MRLLRSGQATGLPLQSRRFPRQISAGSSRQDYRHRPDTTSFVIVRDAEMRKKIAELISTPATKTAPVILVAVSERKINEAKGAANFAFDTQDYAASVENIMLGIVAMGYAGVWMDGMSRMNEADKEIAELLRVPEGKWVRSIIPFGIPTREVAQKEKKRFEERVVWDHF